MASEHTFLACRVSPEILGQIYPKTRIISLKGPTWWEELKEISPASIMVIEEGLDADLIRKVIESIRPQTFTQFYSFPLPKIDSVWSILRIATERVPLGWESVFKEAQNDLAKISEVLERDVKKNKEWAPHRAHLFRAFESTPLHEVRVVIVGQDPYHGLGDQGIPQAMGLSFSVAPGVTIPPSLQNIFKELVTDVKGFEKPNHGDLTKWARQGVLMLNVCLTVPIGQPGAHAKFGVWMPFMRHVFAEIAKVRPGCIYVLWGKESQKIQKCIGEKSTVLTAAHPSSFSAQKDFFGCRHFSKINALLAGDLRGPIDWQI